MFGLGIFCNKKVVMIMMRHFINFFLNQRLETQITGIDKLFLLWIGEVK